MEGADLASIRILLPGGARSERSLGVCVVTGAMLEEGTVRSDWSALAERVEAAGMEIAGFGDYDGHGVAIDCLAGDLRRGFRIAVEVIAHSTFPGSRLDLVRRQEQLVLRAIDESPETMTGWAFLHAIHAGDRRGIPLQGRSGALDVLSERHCIGFHERSLRGGAIVAVAGRIAVAEARALAEASFLAEGVRGPLESSSAREPLPELPPAAVVHVETGAAEQAHIFLGHRTVVRSDPDRLALVVLGTILGGGAGNRGRLPQCLREELGLAYSTYAGLAEGAGLDPGHLVLYAGTAERNVDAVVGRMHRELARILDDPVAASEVEDAKSYILGREPFLRETGRQWANRLIAEELYGLDRAGNLAERLAALSPRKLLDVARRVIRTDVLQTVIGYPGR